MNVFRKALNLIRICKKSTATAVSLSHIEALPSDDGGTTYEIIARGGTFDGRRARILNISPSGAYYNFK